MSDVVYQGYLEKCPQKSGIGKKWNKRYFILKSAGPLGSARLEYYHDMKKQQERSVIPLREVTDVRQTDHRSRPFVFDITTPLLHYRLSATSQRELDTWIDTISNVAFGQGQQLPQPARYNNSMPPRMQPSVEHPPPPYAVGNDAIFGSPISNPGPGYPEQPPSVAGRHTHFSEPNPSTFRAPVQGRIDAGAQGVQTIDEAFHLMPQDNPFLPSAQDLGIQENTLYSGLSAEKQYQVTIVPTEASERLSLHGHYFLHVSALYLCLTSVTTGQRLLTWPLKYLRRYGRDHTKFTFEAGRKCESGPGVYFLGTQMGNAIFLQVHANVKTIGMQQHTSLQQEDIVKGSGSNVGGMKPIVTLPPVRHKDPFQFSLRQQPAAPTPAPRDRQLLRAQSDLTSAVSKTESQPVASPFFTQEVVLEQPNSIPEQTHFYEEGGESTLDKAMSAAAAAAHDLAIVAGPKRTSPPTFHVSAPKTTASQNGQDETIGYNRLARKAKPLKEQTDEPLYDEAELDRLMANIAQHTRLSGNYDTLFHDFSSAAPDNKATSLAATIDDKDLDEVDDIWKTLERRNPYEEVAMSPSANAENSRYDRPPLPQKVNSPLPSYLNVQTEDVDTRPSYMNATSSGDTRLPGYTNVSPNDEEDDYDGLGQFKELEIDDYTPLEMTERVPDKPPIKTNPRDRELDDPSYGVGGKFTRL